MDVGSGSGYLTACMAIMVCVWIIIFETNGYIFCCFVVLKVGERGLAVGIDHIPELVNMSIENIKRDQPNLIESNRVKLIG